MSKFRTYLEGVGGEQLAGFLSGFDWAIAERKLQPHGLRCLRHLGRAAQLAPPAEHALAAELAEHSRAFHWGQTYTAADFGANFIDNYGWLEVFGTRGHFVNDAMAAGVLILGPDIIYPDHHHVAEEIYIPLTGGTAWRKGDGAFARHAAGEVIHHPSGVNHAMRTGAEPLLALYLWRGGPLAERSTIAGQPAQGNG